MSDKTNQATPTHEEYNPDHIDEMLHGFAVAFKKINNAVKSREERNASLLAENEKLRGLLTKSLKLTQMVRADHGWQSAYDLCDEITAALSGEQEGTPLK